ncbi:hypothetical protein GCM10011608_51660 [Micromonospora sonchi]|uniref:TIR domain-containing protein n=1 Tax=Micromonospora sonchi TaxID=1763543 RepID=A0A917U5M0_9ACTN|nr:toll/interleukin-1 receptor domain-containing protein [Micromonospora sonchi]GGM60281.1 hypothetical protein GCM10011608_51660 [Micromonospora sonchi]
MNEQTRYHAFISYHSSGRRVARRLKRDLYAIAKRHAAGAGFAVYLDTSDLRPGPLSDEIRTAVAQSRCLIVLLSRVTVESSWVAQEISHWLASGGTADRLFLVRLDPELDLSWDDSAGTFRNPLALPAPLRGLFPVEQKWIDLADRSTVRGQEGVTGLCAALMDIGANEFLLEEATYQRRRTRTFTAVAALMALLTVAATAGSVAALNSRREAERNAEQALAQADAAEALLAATETPTLAIERALRAARHSDSPTVRSAMLAVSHATRRLTRALTYPEAETGHPAAGGSFSADGTRLVAWGAGREPNSSVLQVWEIMTGRVAATVPTDAADLRDVTFVGSNHLAACAATGPMLINLGTAKSTRLDAAPRAACQVHRFAAGVILLSGDTAPGGASDRHASGIAGGTAYAVDLHGSTTALAGVDSVAAHPYARVAVVTGPAGVAVVTSEGSRLPVPVPSRWSAKAADQRGGFLVSSGGRQWAMIALREGRPHLRKLTVPAAAVDVAPLLNFDRMTGEAAWITADGTIGWTGDNRRTRLPDSQGQPSWRGYGNRLEPLADGRLVAIHRNTAAVVRPPKGSPADVPQGSVPPNAEVTWTQAIVPGPLGPPADDGSEPIAATCADRTGVLVRTNRPDNGMMVIDGAAQGWQLDGRGEFTDSCDVVVIGRTLSFLPDLAPARATVLRDPLTTETVVVPPAGDQVALLKPGFAIEILSTLGPESLPKPWDATVDSGGAVTANGEREVFVSLEKLAISAAGGAVDRVRLPAPAELVAARPDGTGAAVAEYSSNRVWLVDQGSLAPSDACTGKRVAYLPGPDFTTSRADAEAQIPLARVGHTRFVDCRDGRTVFRDPTLEVLSYDIGRETGRIVARSGRKTTITTWSRSGAGGTTTLDGPPLPTDRAITSFDESGRLAVTYTPGTGAVTLHQHDGGGWTTTLRLASRLARITTAQPVDGGTLVLTVGTTGGFELFDVATGRLVAADLGLSVGTDVERVSARRVGDMLAVALHDRGEPAADATIRLPVGIPALRRQLCSIYAAEECVD